MSAAEILQSPQKMSSAQLRKIKKPIIEKRRRERINESLNQLKTLVLEALNKDENQYNKMEKADILEMTVKHLRCLQRQVSQAQKLSSNSPQNAHAQTVTYNLASYNTHAQNVAYKAVAKDTHVQTVTYKSGYSECAEEVRRYLGSTNTVSNEVKHELAAHLTNRVCAPRAAAPENRAPPSPTGSLSSVNSCSSSDSFTCVSPGADSLQSNMCSNSNLMLPVRGSQAMLIAGQVSPVLTGHGFVPIVISPVTSQQAMTSPSITSQPSSPLAGTVIPLYHTSPDQAVTKDFSHSMAPVTPLHANNSSAKSALRFTSMVHNLNAQDSTVDCRTNFCVPKMANYSPEPVWRPW